jgi:hypothetical protein
MTIRKLQESVNIPQITREYFSESANKELRWDGDLLKNAENLSCDFSAALSGFDPKFRAQFKSLFIQYVNLNQYSTTSYWTFALGLNTELRKTRPSIFDLAWASKAMQGKWLRGRVSALSNLLQFIEPRFPNLLGENVPVFLSGISSANTKNSNVLSDDPTKSKFTGAEFSSIVWSILDNFDKGLSGVNVTLIKLLDCHYFRRPIQFSQLKIGDIYFDSEENVSRIYAPRIFFPGAKDRSASTPFRGSKFEYHPIPDHFIDLFHLQINDIKKLFEHYLNCKIEDDELRKLPLFSTKKQIKDAASYLKNHLKIQILKNLDHEAFHLGSHLISRVISWKSNSQMIDKLGMPALNPPVSERTGEAIVITATRMRHSGATRCARMGASRAELTYIMGHSSSKSLEAYYKDSAEEARQLDEIMKISLTELHMTFTGKLLSREEQLSTIKSSPESILEHYESDDLSPVGNCGRHSFCSTQTIPIPCYRCNSFQPFVEANHRLVLEALLHRQKQENEIIRIGSAKSLLHPIDLSHDIISVLNVIAQCEAFKKDKEVEK